MPRRSPVGPREVACTDTLAAAFWRAARGKRHRPEVRRFEADLDGALGGLRADLEAERAPAGEYRSFVIHDPKRRRILAPCFRDRVVHHALMAHMGPVLDRALVADTFACREGKGTPGACSAFATLRRAPPRTTISASVGARNTSGIPSPALLELDARAGTRLGRSMRHTLLAAVHRAQHHLRRFPWFVKADMRAYFASIDHAPLRALLRRRFSNPWLLRLCDRVLARTPDGPGRGLPIGALTSQHFANAYLDALDRHLLETLGVCGMVRYMDDALWWCNSRQEARESLRSARRFVLEARGLELKACAQIGRSVDGVGFLGFRVRRGTLGLSRRRRVRYARARARAEAAFRAGTIDAVGLQRAYAAALAITAHAESTAWRRGELRARPPVDA